MDDVEPHHECRAHRTPRRFCDLTLHGEAVTVRELAAKKGVRERAVYAMLERGLSAEEVLARHRPDASDLTGMKFGTLVVLCKSAKKRGSWRCRCVRDGKEVDVPAPLLLRGEVVSCSCARAQKFFVNGGSLTMAEIARLSGRDKGTIRRRMKDQGMTIDQAAFGPPARPARVATDEDAIDRRVGDRGATSEIDEAASGSPTPPAPPTQPPQATQPAGPSTGTKKPRGLASRALHDRKNEDLTGQSFHFLLVLGPAPDRRSGSVMVRMWRCRCVICGTEKDVRGATLHSGLSKSCGYRVRAKGKGSIHRDFFGEELTAVEIAGVLDTNYNFVVGLLREGRSSEEVVRRCSSPRVARFMGPPIAPRSTSGDVTVEDPSRGV